MANYRSNFKFENEYIRLTRGDTLSFGFEIEGVDNLETAFFTCKKDINDNVNLFKKSLGNGITKTDDGYVVRVAPADTKNAEIGKYFYDLQIGVNNDIFTVLKGVLELTYDVSE